MTSPGYNWQRLRMAVEALATSSAPIQTRVEHAAMGLLTLRGDDFTDADELAAFRRVMDALTSRAGTAGEGAFAASSRAMSDDEAEAVAQDIFTLFGRYSGPSSPTNQQR